MRRRPERQLGALAEDQQLVTGQAEGDQDRAGLGDASLVAVDQGQQKHTEHQTEDQLCGPRRHQEARVHGDPAQQRGHVKTAVPGNRGRTGPQQMCTVVSGPVVADRGGLCASEVRAPVAGTVLLCCPAAFGCADGGGRARLSAPSWPIVRRGRPSGPLTRLSGSWCRALPPAVVMPSAYLPRTLVTTGDRPFR